MKLEKRIDEFSKAMENEKSIWAWFEQHIDMSVHYGEHIKWEFQHGDFLWIKGKRISYHPSEDDKSHWDENYLLEGDNLDVVERFINLLIASPVEDNDEV